MCKGWGGAEMRTAIDEGLQLEVETGRNVSVWVCVNVCVHVREWRWQRKR